MISILGDGFETFTEALLSPLLAALGVTLSGLDLSIAKL